MRVFKVLDDKSIVKADSKLFWTLFFSTIGGLPGNLPCRGDFLHVNRTQKLPRDKSSLAHAHY